MRLDCRSKRPGQEGKRVSRTAPHLAMVTIRTNISIICANVVSGLLIALLQLALTLTLVGKPRKGVINDAAGTDVGEQLSL
jgi:hypothetical protein